MAKRWTQRRRLLVEDWVTTARSLMALSDWTITFDWGGNEFTHPTHGPVQALATMTPAPSSKHATLAVSNELLEYSPEAVTQVLTHELVHCHLFALHEHATGSFELSTTNKLATKLFQQSFTQHVETTTDALADAFSRILSTLTLS